jgi:hypothetical protein
MYTTTSAWLALQNVRRASPRPFRSRWTTPVPGSSAVSSPATPAATGVAAGRISAAELDEVATHVADRTLAEHQAIDDALVLHDAPLAQAAALVHVSTTEKWLREHLSDSEEAR